MSNQITSTQYWNEVSALAQMVAEEAMQQSGNDRSEAEELINDIHKTSKTSKTSRTSISISIRRTTLIT